MKTHLKNYLLIIALFFTSVTVCSAKWRPLTQVELSQKSDLIVVAEYVEEISKVGGSYNSVQLSKLKILRKLKGGAHVDELKVYGYCEKICAPRFQFQAKAGEPYLLFLEKHKDGHRVINGRYGALRVIDGKVRWFVAEAPLHKRELTDLKVVIGQITEK